VGSRNLHRHLVAVLVRAPHRTSISTKAVAAPDRRRSPVTRSRFYARGPYPLECPLREGSSPTAHLPGGQLCSLQGLGRHLRLEDIRFPMAFIEELPRPAETASASSANRMNKYGPSAGWVCTIKPKPVGPSGKNYGRVVYEVSSPVGLDFDQGRTRTSTPSRSSAGQNVSEFVAESRFESAQTGKPARRRGTTQLHAPLLRRMYERAEFRQRNRPADHHARLITGGFNCQTPGLFRSGAARTASCCKHSPCNARG